MNKPNGIVVYTVVVLRHADRYLLLERAATKRVQPGRWTGMGGRVETNEMDDVRAAALRELHEESGITISDVADFTLRRAIFHARPGGPLTVLLYYTGTLETPVLPPCPEGTLAWVTPDAMATRNLVDNARVVFPLLIEDQRRDPEGREPVRLGVNHFEPDGAFAHILWT